MRTDLISPATCAHVRYVIRLRRLRGALHCTACGFPSRELRAQLGEEAVVGALARTRQGVRCYSCRTGHRVEHHHRLGRRTAPHLTVALSANLHRALHFLSGWARFDPALAALTAHLLGASP